MLKRVVAVLIVTATPALAADNILSSRVVQFDQISFTCGKTDDAGKVVRFIHAAPGAKYIPEYELAATDPLAKSWDITYRIICEGGYRQPNIAANVGNPVR